MSEKLDKLALQAYQNKRAKEEAERKKEEDIHRNEEATAAEKVTELLKNALSTEVLNELPDFSYTYDRQGGECFATICFTYLGCHYSIRPSFDSPRLSVNYWVLLVNGQQFYPHNGTELEACLLEQIGMALDMEQALIDFAQEEEEIA